MSSGKVVLGVLAGLATGAIAGLLFAPAKGKDTRKKIAKKGKDYEKKLGKKFNKNIDNASKKFSKLKSDVSDFVEKKCQRLKPLKNR